MGPSQQQSGVITVRLNPRSSLCKFLGAGKTHLEISSMERPAQAQPNAGRKPHSSIRTMQHT